MLLLCTRRTQSSIALSEKITEMRHRSAAKALAFTIFVFLTCAVESIAKESLFAMATV